MAIQSTTMAALWPSVPVSFRLRRRMDLRAPRLSFLSSSVQILLAPQRAVGSTSAPRFLMSVASRQAFICRDCGYIYNDRTPFDKLPDKYFCPVCGAPKSRFRPYQLTVATNANETNVRKARKTEMKRDEVIGRALPVAIVLGFAVLVGLYFYLNSVY